MDTKLLILDLGLSFEDVKSCSPSFSIGRIDLMDCYMEGFASPTSNENKLSDGHRERTSLEAKRV